MTTARKSRFSPFPDYTYEDYEYDHFNDNTYITCYPGSENTYREPWFDPDMEPIHYAGEKPVYRFRDMRLVADGTGESDKGRVLVYQGERLVAEFPTRSVVVLSYYNSGFYLYADSLRSQFEFVFEESEKALESCNTFCRLGII